MYSAFDDEFYVCQCWICNKQYTTKEFLELDLLPHRTAEQCEQDIPPDSNDHGNDQGYILVYRNCKCNNTLVLKKIIRYSR